MSGFWQKGQPVERMDWIATTEDVRAMWNLSQSDEVAFDRWLVLYGAQKFTDGAKFERERIIKLLEADRHIWRERIALVALIALIKGENK